MNSPDLLGIAVIHKQQVKNIFYDEIEVSVKISHTGTILVTLLLEI